MLAGSPRSRISSLAASIELPVFEDRPPDDANYDDEHLAENGSSPEQEQETVLPKQQTSSRGPHVQQLFTMSGKSETNDSLATVSTEVLSPTKHNDNEEPAG